MCRKVSDLENRNSCQFFSFFFNLVNRRKTYDLCRIITESLLSRIMSCSFSLFQFNTDVSIT